MKTLYKQLRFLFSIMILIGIFTSCSKTEVVPPTDTPKTIFDLNVSPNFDWKTTKELTLNIQGLALPRTVRNSIMVTTVDGNGLFYTDQIDMDKNYTLQFAVPSVYTQVKITYGTISKAVDINGAVLHFDYSQE